MARLQYLVIHCTATPEGRPVTSKNIRDWHTLPFPKGRGWKQVGYSDMIHLNGSLETLVPYNNDDNVDLWEITNGVAGMNSVCRHVVYVGGTDQDNRYSKDTRTKEQRLTLANYIKQTIAAHPEIQVAGHYQFDSGKACPSFKVPDWLRAIGIPEKNIYNPL